MPKQDFNERLGDPQIPPPYSFQDVTIWSFGLAVDDREVLEKLIDDHLNVGPKDQVGFDYQALTGFVSLEVVTYGRMMSESTVTVEGTAFKDMGFCTQTELYFRVTVGRYELGELGWDHKDTAIFIPYIFVDNPWSVIAGREVTGYPKVWAEFKLPQGSRDDYPITVSTHVFRHHNPGSPQEVLPFVEIRSTQGASPPTDLKDVSTWPWGDDAGEVSFPRAQSKQERNSIQLKQFRDAKDHTLACYKALVRSQFELKNMNITPLVPATILLHSYDSLPLVRKLGLGSSTLSSVWQFKVECDMRVHGHKNIFEA